MRVIARAQARAEAHPFPPRRGRPTSGVAHEADDNIRPHLRMLAGGADHDRPAYGPPTNRLGAFTAVTFLDALAGFHPAPVPRPRRPHRPCGDDPGLGPVCQSCGKVLERDELASELSPEYARERDARRNSVKMTRP